MCGAANHLALLGISKFRWHFAGWFRWEAVQIKLGQIKSLAHRLCLGRIEQSLTTKTRTPASAEVRAHGSILWGNLDAKTIERVIELDLARQTRTLCPVLRAIKQVVFVF